MADGRSILEFLHTWLKVSGKKYRAPLERTSVNDFGSINIVLLWSTSRLMVLSTTTSHATPGATRPKLDS
jgi:hypothetical protein